jgi:uncharacterized protein (DUF302 family)
MEASQYFKGPAVLDIFPGDPRYERVSTAQETEMLKIAATLSAALLCAAVFLLAPIRLDPAGAVGSHNGVVRVKSAYGMDETIGRLKKNIEAKGIKFFMAVDQSELGKNAGIKLNPSTLLIFGNPPLGIQFLTSNPDSGLDWPVRLLVNQDASGQVWTVYTDFSWIAQRHGITDRDAQFKMASEVVASITSSVAAK